MKNPYCFVILLLFFTGLHLSAPGQTTGSRDFTIVSNGKAIPIIVSEKEKPVVRIAAQSLSEDILDISNIQPVVKSDRDPSDKIAIMIGTAQSPAIKKMAAHYRLPDLRNKWEHFMMRVLKDSVDKQKVTLLIIGSDARGAAFGTFTLSRLLGVSPWKWWADVKPVQSDEIIIHDNLSVEDGPSVRFRGIFLNDEDWGLRPWAAKNFEPEVSNIGPKTYAKIFELLLRLKANTIWPAMHPGTTPFFQVKGNDSVAKKYDIFIGSSHAEPMLRNNVGEWNTEKRGAFNYVTNRDSVFNYWKERVAALKGGNDIFTLGMRGIHDSKMLGASTLVQQKEVLSQVLEDQRGLLKQFINKDLDKVPQAFIPYKEVLPVYDGGLKVPEDVTLVWPDDNYGYIRRLSDEHEQKRPGGSGVYYHVSYWGRPHDYLWISTTQPGLIWEEMKKAWIYDARRMWILNVGDIKPAEYNIQLFLDLAWDIDSLRPDNLRDYMQTWVAQTLDKKNAGKITDLMEEYYRLAFIRRPEFMGWSQTEPTTHTGNTAYHPFSNGDEIEHRVRAYKSLISSVDKLGKEILPDRQAAFFELVTYPVKGAAYMNEKLLYAQKSRLFSKYKLPAAKRYADSAVNAYDSIKILTDFYNSLENGKWRGMMDSAPRELPVFDPPVLDTATAGDSKGVLVWAEGDTVPGVKSSELILPKFNPYTSQEHFFSVFNRGNTAINWKIETDQEWIKVSKSSGRLGSEERINVHIDWHKVPDKTEEGTLKLKAGDELFSIGIFLQPAIEGRDHSQKLLVENDKKVFIEASWFSSKKDFSDRYKWTSIRQLGYNNNAWILWPVPGARFENTKGAHLEYRFYTYSNGPAEITIFTIPTHPVNDKRDVRVAVSLDDKDKQVTSFKTTGRSEQWKQNVLRNHAPCVFHVDFDRPGWHTIRVYPLDPGVIIDQALVDFDPAQTTYAFPFGKKDDSAKK